MQDNTNPIGKWEFNEDVTKVFGDMLSRSIPNYETMRELCFRVGRNFLHEGSVVADIGCSNGLSVEKFVRAYPDNHFILNDVSEPMLSACRERYREEVESGNVVVLNYDLRDGVPFSGVDLCISCLTIQFTPIEYRQKILSAIYDGLREGGALILVEKVLGKTSTLDSLFVKEYYDIKRENGYSEERIATKRKSLEGVLVPLTSEFNEHLLDGAGFRKYDCFWRCLNFCAWVAIK